MYRVCRWQPDGIEGQGRYTSHTNLSKHTPKAQRLAKLWRISVDQRQGQSVVGDGRKVKSPSQGDQGGDVAFET